MLKKTDRILIPLLFFSLISLGVGIALHHMDGPFNGPLWFLKTMFLAITIYSLVDRLLPQVGLSILVALGLLFFIVNVDLNPIVSLPKEILRVSLAIVYIHIGRIVAPLFAVLLDKSLAIKWGGVIISGLLYGVVVFYLISNSNTSGASFVNTRVFSTHFIVFAIASISGSMLVILLTMIVGKMRGVAWLGTNSLVIMCTHFPIIERLNLYFGSRINFQLYQYKVLYLLLIYVIIGVSSLLFIVIAKRCLPALTGYRGLVSEFVTRRGLV